MYNNILFDEAQITANYLKKFFGDNLPKIGVILGSGLGEFINITKIIKSINYFEIPLFPISHVEGHRGILSLVELADGKTALVLEGRFHLYEGYSIQEVTFPVAVFHLLGIEYLIVSNAAGGCNPNFNVGDLMLISDHINFTGYNPLIGKNNSKLGQRFLDQTEPYSQQLINVAHNIAKKLSFALQEGVYIAVSGPTYETKAEIKAFQVLGADAVGMSTIHEVIIANYFGIRVLGISCITNMATGISQEKHSHTEVVKSAKETASKFSLLVKEVILAI